MLLFIIGACNNAAEHTQDNSRHHEHDQHHNELSSASLSAVSLNNGKTWSANPATTEGIHNMLHRMEEFENSGSQDYESLERDLQAEFSGIVKNCTMKSEAHDQLHNYLMPLKEDIDQLNEENLDQVKTHLEAYPRYFE